MDFALTEDDFIFFLVSGSIVVPSGDTLIMPKCFYKKVSGEINAEKIMMVVLKARSRKREKKARPIVTSPPAPSV